MLKFSTDLMNSLCSDEVYTRIHDEAKQQYSNGDRTALMTMVIACAQFQKIIPDWLADELIGLDGKISSSEFKDVNEFFAFKPEHQSKLRSTWLLHKHEKIVMDALYRHRIDGGNFTAGDGLESVATETGVPRRTVEAIYKKHKRWLKDAPLKTEQNSGYLFAEAPSQHDFAKHIRSKSKDDTLF